ncbi:hypothetical protein D3C83_35400 [compost metagenome]
MGSYGCSQYVISAATRMWATLSATPRLTIRTQPRRSAARTTSGATATQKPQQPSCHTNIRANECPCVSIER